MVIKLSNLSKSFNKNELFNNLNLEVPQGSTVGIIGENGSGKSVLFKLIAGLEKPDKGEVIVDNIYIGKEQDFPNKIGIMVNQPGYMENLNGLENLKLLAEIKGIINEDSIIKTMKRVGLDSSNRTPVKNYSMGMKQKLGIAQSIMENQSIILLDEPFNALDHKSTIELFNIIRSIKDEGKSLLITSHQHEILEKVCDEIYIIEDKNLLKLNKELKEKYFKFE